MHILNELSSYCTSMGAKLSQDKNHKKLPRTLIKVPEDLDKQVAVDALKAMSVGIDKLTPKQIEYMHSW